MKKKIKSPLWKPTLYLEVHVAIEEQCWIITGVASQGKLQMEKIWGFECCWHFPKGLFTPRTYLLMLAVMTGCQQRDKVLSVNHRPLQWSRSTDAWPWWTLSCNRETKRGHQKISIFRNIQSQKGSFSHELLHRYCVSRWSLFAG